MNGRLRLGRLRGVAKASRERTEQVRQEKAAKKAKRETNSYTVEEWFLKATRDKYGAGYVVARWTGKERTLAKGLLTEYGDALVADAVKYLFAEWDGMVAKSKGGLTGVPTINLLWGMRARVFGDVQLRKMGKQPPKRRDSDEFNGSGGAPEIGW